jgi:hypothetical protein
MEEDDDVMNVSHHGRSVISSSYLLNPVMGVFLVL